MSGAENVEAVSGTVNTEAVSGAENVEVVSGTVNLEAGVFTMAGDFKIKIKAIQVLLHCIK